MVQVASLNPPNFGTTARGAILVAPRTSATTPAPQPEVFPPAPIPEIELVEIGVQSFRYRFDLLNADLSLAGTIPIRTDVPPRMRNNSAALIKRRMDLTPEPGVLEAIDVLKARIRPMLITADGTEFPMGVFMFADALDTEFIPDNEHSTVLVDQGLILAQESDRTFGVTNGDEYEQVISGILNDHGFTGYSVETGHQHTSSEPVAWPVGTPWLVIINELAQLAGAFDLYFNNAGFATVIPAPDVDSPTIIYNESKPRFFLGGRTSSQVPLDAPNRFVVVEGSAADVPNVGVYNVPDAAPHSAFNRGFVVTRTKILHGICSPADHCAKAFAKANDDDFESASFISSVDPRHDTFDVLDLEGLRYREHAWNAELDGRGDMRHDLRRSYDNE